MNRFPIFALAAILLCLAGAQSLPAQTISVYAGNGQLICFECSTLQTQAGVSSVFLQQYDPLYVKVTDANGNPLANASVNWSITSGAPYLFAPANLVTQTDSNGIAHITFTAAATSSTQNGPTQSMVTATLATNPSSVAAFTLTQTSTNALGSSQIKPDLNQNPNGTVPVPGDTLNGTAGASGTAITLGLLGQGTALAGGNSGIVGPLQGVSVRLINYQSNPTVTCAGGAGADPGSVLTDSTGYATCTPVFSGSGTGQFALLVGGEVQTSSVYSDGTHFAAQPPYVGVLPTSDPTAPQPTWGGFIVNGPINLSVAPAAVSTVQFVSGNNQTANAGQSLASPLVAVVTSTAGTKLSNQAVTWAVSPAGAATLSNTTTTTDVNGNASTNVTLSNSANGQVLVTVTSGGKSATFTINAVLPTTLSSMQKLSGDGQVAIENAPFPNPLVVQVNVSSGSPANLFVQFSVTGPASLSATSAQTDSNGRASVTVTAGSTPGSVTVTASSGSFSQSFTLTVSPPGPQLTAGAFVNGADFQVGSISPCSIATVIAAGLAPNLSGVALSNSLGVGPLNYTVATDSVTVAGAQAPIYNVANVNGQQQITFQVPCSVAAGTNVPVTVNVGGGSATVNVTILPASPGVFGTSSSVNVAPLGSLPIAVIAKRDGTFVTPQNPARVGETVIAYVTGLGPTSPSVATNALPIFGVASSVTGKVIVGINNAGVPVSFAQLSEDMLGVYLVAFQIPTGTATGNVDFSIGVAPVGATTVYYSNPTAIYIQ